MRDKQLIVIDDQVLWVQQDWKDFPEKIPSALKVAGDKGKDIGQYVLLVIPPLSEIVNEVWEAAQNSQVVDFESFKQRAKANCTNVA